MITYDYLKNLTKEQAIEEHRKMWNWIADKTSELQLCMTKDDYITQELNIDINSEILLHTKSSCFCCLYASNVAKTVEKCKCCPIDWGKHTTDSYMCERVVCTADLTVRGIYSEWVYALENYDYEECARLARQIANLPEAINK